jgi:hypothetical protein
MECNKWQEEGLLYVSREMNALQAKEYEKHVQLCDVCRNEIDQYILDKKALFSADILCESPSEAVDKKIITACSYMPKTSRSITLFSTVWFKRAVISMVFLVFGTGAGIYFTMNYYNATTNGTALASHKTPSAPAVASGNQGSLGSLAKSQDSALSNKKDSLKQKETAPFVNRQHSTPQQGMVTVDLKKE